jgi:hypothetical protein
MDAIDFLISEHNRVRTMLCNICEGELHYETKKQQFQLLSDREAEMAAAKKKAIQKADMVEPRIFTILGQKVILDADLSRIYGVPTFRFNEAVKRNKKRFPPDFMFQLKYQ